MRGLLTRVKKLESSDFKKKSRPILVIAENEDDLKHKVDQLCYTPSKVYAIVLSDFVPRSDYKPATFEERQAHLLSLGLVLATK